MAQFLSCPSHGPHLPCATLPVRSLLRGQVAGLVAAKDVSDYRSAVQLALGTLNVCLNAASLPRTTSPSPPPPLKSSQSCLKALVVFSAGTLETLTDLFDHYNVERRVRDTHTHFTWSCLCICELLLLPRPLSAPVPPPAPPLPHHCTVPAPPLQITVFSYLVGPPVEVMSVKEMGCHNNQGYYSGISTESDIPEKLLVSFTSNL